MRYADGQQSPNQVMEADLLQATRVLDGGFDLKMTVKKPWFGDVSEILEGQDHPFEKVENQNKPNVFINPAATLPLTIQKGLVYQQNAISKTTSVLRSFRYNGLCLKGIEYNHNYLHKIHDGCKTTIFQRIFKNLDIPYHNKEKLSILLKFAIVSLKKLKKDAFQEVTYWLEIEERLSKMRKFSM